MPDAHTHEIVVRGRLGLRLLGPFSDDFTVDHDETGLTRLRGLVRDTSHLHGLVAYLASINAELISITPVISSLDIRTSDIPTSDIPTSDTPTSVTPTFETRSTS